MSAPIVELAKGLKTKLDTVTGKTFHRCYQVQPEDEDLVNGKWFLMPAVEDFQKVKRVDKSTLSVDIGYFRSLPEATDENPVPDQNLDWLDDQMSEVETVKTLFREDGALADIVVSDCVFIGMSNNPVYHPDPLADSQVFISIIRLEFLVES